MATKVVTGPCRLSYEHIWTPKAVADGQEPKFSAAILIPKTDTATIAGIKEAIRKEAAQAYPNGKVPPNFKLPLKDGDTLLDKDGKPRLECLGHYVINASSNTRPGIVDAACQPILDKSLVYSGCYCNFQLGFATYNLPTSKGVGAYLNNVQKVKDGPSLAGRDDPKDVFKPVPVSDDDC